MPVAQAQERGQVRPQSLATRRCPLHGKDAGEHYDIDAIMAHGTYVMWRYTLVEVSHVHLNYDEVHRAYIDAYSLGRRLNTLNGLNY